MIYLPCLDVPGHIPFASEANVNIRFLLHNAVLHRKLVPTDRSMVYLPCLHVTGHIPFASGANINICFRNDLRVPHLETVTTCAPVIYLARAYTAPQDFWQAGQTYWKLLPFLAAFASFASNVTVSVALALFCCLQLISACLSVLLSVPSSTLRCFACGGAFCIWAISCSLFRFRSTMAAQPSAIGRTALFLPLLSSRLPRTSAGPSVVISVPFSCLWCIAFGPAAFVWGLSCSLFRFRSAMASQTSAMARAFFSSAALLASTTSWFDCGPIFGSNHIPIYGGLIWYTWSSELWDVYQRKFRGRNFRVTDF